ncbi:hypothetical protein Kpol_1048p16 [Vanderwaltozyma polyspora DSM 70294]|uniref:H/ACA ribonucleoprotein complex non-core subunit NAF1 n=1 Tax=Vanderwaltozyma polyspora (strain ATCC 22028 / DSM 70294 / BCRC 21397 / CBS 2163 / NBRC 10782 / NRRL Y-8283 / UCD 57-17) TaxID=436907 RepID=A7TGH9_VANPO|nr:uncharacterized protein Kpol_1048p16 [Vanderwaltozyma polyspora DSM 70294]EDO18586.1 hypothetical protein Kpol_1048p16 [Vanderwaltozyma polyspora DSM 70294]
MSEDLFAKALEENGERKNELLPLHDDIDIGDISSSDEESESKKEEKVGDINEDIAKGDNEASESSSPSSSSSLSSSSEGDDSETSDDDDNDNEAAAESDIEEEAIDGPIRSKNELTEEPVIGVPEDYLIDISTEIKNIGKIKSVIDKDIIVELSGSGENRILKEGTIFCLNDRTIIGTLAEVFGKLTNPLYRIVASNKDSTDNLKEKIGEDVFYVIRDAHWLDTFELKKVKGTDASNGYDEELPEEEQEFSDDEKESMFKKMKKKQKKNKNSTRSSDNSENVTNRVHKQPLKNNSTHKIKQYPSMKFPNETPQSSYRSRDQRQQVNSNTTNKSRPVQSESNSYNRQEPARNNMEYSHPNHQFQEQYMNNYPKQVQHHQIYPPNMNYPQQPYNPGPQFQPPVPYQQFQYQGHSNGSQQYIPNGPNDMHYQNQYSYPHHQPVPPPPNNMNQVMQLHQLLMQQQQQQHNQQHNQQQQQHNQQAPTPVTQQYSFKNNQPSNQDKPYNDY